MVPHDLVVLNTGGHSTIFYSDPHLPPPRTKTKNLCGPLSGRTALRHMTEVFRGACLTVSGPALTTEIAKN